MKKYSVCWALIFLCQLFLTVSCNQSCSLTEGKHEVKESKVKILSWNLQTFFDCSNDGNEYAEFKGAGSGWSKEKYEVRLDRLCEVVSAVDPDIFVMQELEKQVQLYDIYNRLCSNFNLSKNYSWGCFAKDEDSAIGCGIISRYELSDMSVHGIDIRSEDESQPSMRPLIKVTATVNDKKLQILVNHWKSKSGGEEESEVWRNYQELILTQNFAEAYEKQNAVIACGDFNRDILEFQKQPGKTVNGNILLRGKENVAVYSPWYDSGGNLVNPGSYWYKGTWERIDHFFAGKNTRISDFKVENSRSWSSSEGQPLKYLVKYGTGYSDHFPVSCFVTW